MSPIARRVLPLPGLLLLGMTALFSCAPLQSRQDSPPQLVPIASLQYSRDLGQRVRVEGRVAEVVPLVRSRAYRLEDESGEIWILDSQGDRTLTVGASLQVEGQLAAESITPGDGVAAEIYVRQQRQL